MWIRCEVWECSYFNSCKEKDAVIHNPLQDSIRNEKSAEGK